MPETIIAEAHLFLSKARSKISLDYLRGLLQLGADPFRDPVLEGLEGKESLIYASKVNATLVAPAKPLRILAPSLAKGLVRLLLTCPRPSIRFGEDDVPHFYSIPRKFRWQVRLATRPQYQFTISDKEFFVVTRLALEKNKEQKWIGVLGRKKKRIVRSEEEPTYLVPAS